MWLYCHRKKVFWKFNNFIKNIIFYISAHPTIKYVRFHTLSCFLLFNPTIKTYFSYHIPLPRLLQSPHTRQIPHLSWQRSWYSVQMVQNLIWIIFSFKISSWIYGKVNKIFVSLTEFHLKLPIHRPNWLYSRQCISRFPMDLL